MKNEDLLSHYHQAFEPWKARLALGRIKAMRFPRTDWPDLMQELAIVIIQFKYDPHHGNGATEQTALFAALNRHLLFLMRGRCRDRCGFEHYLRSLGVREDGSFGGAEPCFEVDMPLSMSVAQAIHAMPALDRAVALGLAQGLTRGAIARRLGCDWKTVNSALRRIAARFEKSDIDLKEMR